MGRLWRAGQDGPVTTADILRRSDSDSVVAGVCGGIAQHYRIDPMLVRLAAVIIALSSGVGLVLYGAAWLLLPRGDGQPALVRAFPTVARVRRRTWTVAVAAAALVVLVLVGVIFNASLLPTMVVLGILYASQLRPGTKGSSAPGLTGAAPQTYRPRPGPAGADWPLLAPPQGDLVITTPAGPWRPTNRLGQPLTAQDCAAFYAVPDPIGLYERPATTVPVRPSRILALVSGLAIAAVFAMMSLLGAFVTVPPVTYLAVGLVGVGLSLIVGAFVGRPSGFLAVAVALVLVAGTVSSSMNASHYDTTWAPSTVSDLATQAQVAGAFRLDLASTVIDETRTVQIQVDGGDAQIIVPKTGNVAIVYADQYGDVSMPDGSSGRMGAGRWSRVSNSTEPTLTISITVNLGDLDVRQ